MDERSEDRDISQVSMESPSRNSVQHSAPEEDQEASRRDLTKSRTTDIGVGAHQGRGRQHGGHRLADISLQEVLDDATYGLAQQLPGVSFKVPRRLESFLMGDTFNISPTGSAPIAPQLIFPLQQVQALAGLGLKLRKVVSGQAAEYEEVLGGLTLLDKVSISLRQPDGLMTRQLWRLQDLRDGRGLGYTI